MELLVKYQPIGEDWIEFDVEKGVSISRRRDSYATAKINLSSNFSTRNNIDAGNVQIFLNKHNLFDGTVEKIGFGKDSVTYTCYDQLYKLHGVKRIFYQSTDGITPTQILTDLFDENSTSSYVTEDSGGAAYTGPWVDGFDALTYIVPAETTYDESLDCENRNGLQYLDFLMDISQRGNIYKYFYWYENINNDEYIFAEPEGWGKTYRNLE